MIHRTSGESLLSFMTPNPVVVSREDSLDRALEVMTRFRFRHLPVVEGDEVVGILSDRDLRLATSLLPADERRLGGARGKIAIPEHVGEAMRSPVHCLELTTSPAAAARELVQRRIGAMPVVEEGSLVGIVTETDFLSAFLDLCRVNQGSCDDLVRYHMDHRVARVTRKTTLEEGFERMNRHTGHLAVVEGGRLVGILSERDLLLGLSRSSLADARAEENGRLAETPRVGDVMTAHVVTTYPGATLSESAQAMIAYRFHALPVLEEEELVGMLSLHEIIEYYAYLL